MTSAPYDWIQVVKPSTDETFFINPATGDFQIDKPNEGSIRPVDPQGSWLELWDEINQLPYYYHIGSRQAHWTQPADPTTTVVSLRKLQDAHKKLDVEKPEDCFSNIPSLSKRNSRSLDLPPTRIGNTSATHLHRSTSDGNSKMRQQQKHAPPSLLTEEESHDSLSAALPSSQSAGLFGFMWPRKHSVSSDMGGLAGRQRRMSNFSAFRNKSSTPWKNLVTRSQTSPCNSITVCSPVSPSDMSPQEGLQDQTSEAKPALPLNLQNEITQFAIDGFAQKYFAKHKRGIIFKRQVPIYEMLQWTKDSLKQPLIMLNKDLYKDALKCFKIIQTIMGDRPRPRHSNEIEEYQTLLNCGITKGQMRDEIYVQICKQLHNNLRGNSIQRGWEILCVVSVTFPPSKNLESYLHHFVDQHKHITLNHVDIMSQYVSTRLIRICARGAKGKVLTAAEIERAKEAPFKPSIFGEDLDMIITLPNHRDNGLKIPKIVPFLADAVLEMNGQRTEGIFRVPGDAEEITDLRVRIENGTYDATGITDPNVPASLLKYWLRDLERPLISSEFYDKCIKCAENPAEAIEIINSLPELNRRVVMYMIAFVQEFNRDEVTVHTRMNVNNLAMVFAPNFLRCPSESLTTVFENSKYEQAFVKTLLLHLSTDKAACAYQEQCPGGTLRQ
ncbi:hypothetical protein BX666DRAFT_1951155 [Dichotomocladium elegans]|nr:hypothetical protein BX666DRAFT_1951155 [Dichotomocladium elegans]